MSETNAAYYGHCPKCGQPPTSGGFLCGCKQGNQYDIHRECNRVIPVLTQTVTEQRERIAALEAKLAACEWRTFESAPTDGTEIIVYREDAGAFMASFTPSAGDDGEYGPQMNGDECWFECNSGVDLSDCLPTHWMPTPKPPSMEGACPKQAI